MNTHEEDLYGLHRPSAPSPETARRSSGLRLLRVIVHAAFHISDITFRLDRLHELKPGAIDEILCAVAQIGTSIAELESRECREELAQARSTEVGHQRGTARTRL
jgi:hypothetical protein